jgi:ketosteroid isomerase-like protein
MRVPPPALFASFFVPLIFTTACASQSLSDKRSLGIRSQIEHAHETLEADARAHDVEKLVKDFYAAQTIVAFGGPRVVRNVDDAKAFWKDLLEHGTIAFHTEQLETSCDLVSELGRWTLRVEAEEGDFREERGVYYVTWKRVDGQWKAAIHAFMPGGFGDVD